jgi:5-bromo-4-chloroindolyl phosphate hydrolysis protein
VEISEKISRLELIVSRIFEQVAKDPSLAPELHQFMSYYLPTTQKLLDVYAELDVQPVQGQNISETKSEIEGTLDTINRAFENLLDSCYKDTAWDVSTDISVLNTMLEKEGLTGDELDKVRSERDE